MRALESRAGAGVEHFASRARASSSTFTTTWAEKGCSTVQYPYTLPVLVPQYRLPTPYPYCRVEYTPSTQGVQPLISLTFVRGGAILTGMKELLHRAQNWAIDRFILVLDLATKPAYRRWVVHFVASVSVAWAFGTIFGHYGFAVGAGLALAFYLYRGVGRTFWEWANQTEGRRGMVGTWDDAVGSLAGPTGLFIGSLLTIVLQ